MPNEELILLKRYDYNKYRDYDVNPERRTWTDLITISALDVYAFHGTAYIVSTYWYNKYYSDMGDRCLDLVLKVYPVDPADVDNEEKVRAIAKDTHGFIYRPTSQAIDDRTEETFTESIHRYVIRALTAFLEQNG